MNSSSTYVNLRRKKTTLTTKWKKKPMSQMTVSTSWMKKRKVKRKRKWKRPIMLISKKWSKKMPTNFWAGAWLVQLIQLSLPNKSLANGSRASSLSKDWWKSMKSKLKPSIRKSGFSKMIRKWEKRKKPSKFQSSNHKRNQHLISQKRKRSTRSSITQDIVRPRKVLTRQCLSSRFHWKMLVRT